MIKNTDFEVFKTVLKHGENMYYNMLHMLHMLIHVL